MTNDSQSKDLESLKQAAIAEWEEEWEAMDFSWEGLADAGWGLGNRASEAQKLKRWRAPVDFPGGGAVQGEGDSARKEATQQDFWRWSIGITDDDPTRLLSDEELLEKGLLERDKHGKLWHAIHRTEANVSPALLQDALLARINSAYEVYDITFIGINFLKYNYININGAKYKDLSSILVNISDDYNLLKENFYLKFNHTYIENLHYCHSTKYTRFELKNSIYETSKIELNGNNINNISFDSCDIFHIFFPSASEFNYSIKIDSSAIYNEIRFSEYKTSENINFCRVKFRNNVKFNECEFNTLNINNGNYLFNIDKSTYTSTFYSAVEFTKIKIIDRISLNTTIFMKNAKFENCHFGNNADFEEITFNADVNFINCTFGENASFSNTKFNGDICFKDCHFGKNTSFRNTEFHNGANFYEAIFEDRISFVGAQFCGPTRFEGATFKGAAFFKDCTLPEAFEDGLNAFRATRFYELVSFDDTDIACFAAFHETRFFKGVILSQPGERRAQELWDEALEAAITATKGKDKPSKERYFAALEGGCRVLKQEMEKIADRSREQRYFRYELIARRHRPDINATERIISRIYGVLSSYGNSIGRPLLCLILSVPVMMLIYGFVDLGIAMGFPFTSDMLHLALANILQPGAVWGSDAGAPGSILSQLSGGSSWGLLGLRLLSTAHTLFAAIMVFLAGVAIRRKFRIG